MLEKLGFEIAQLLNKYLTCDADNNNYNYQARNSSNNNPSYPPPLPSGNVSKRQRSPSPDYREDRVPIEHGSYDKNARVRK